MSDPYRVQGERSRDHECSPPGALRRLFGGIGFEEYRNTWTCQCGKRWEWHVYQSTERIKVGSGYVERHGRVARWEER